MGVCWPGEGCGHTLTTTSTHPRMKISWNPVGSVFHMEQHIELGMDNCILYLFALYLCSSYN